MKIKELKTEIERLEVEHSDLSNYRKNIDGYEELENKITKMRTDYLNSNYKRKEEIRKWILDYKKEIKSIQEGNKIQVPSEIDKWFYRYHSGVDFGYGQIRISWISKNNEWIIVSSPGSITGTGTAMGTGGYYTSPTEHWLANTTKGTYIENNYYPIRKIEGRLTKEKKAELIAMIPEAEKHLNEPK